MTPLETLEVTEAQLGSLVGRSDRTIRRWVKAGRLQHVAPGRLRLVDALPAVVAIIEEASDGTELQAARLKKLEAEASLAELELRERSGALVSAEAVHMANAHAYSLIRATMMNVPTRAVLQLLGETREEVFKATLRREISDGLTHCKDALVRRKASDIAAHMENPESEDQ